jgi:hypothetical protein
MVCTNSAKLNGLVEIIAGGKEFIVRKLTIISLIMLMKQSVLVHNFSNANFASDVSIIVKSFIRWTYV